MRIGIITFQRAYNYGAVLQAYALCRTINNIGYKCEVIDYHNPKFERNYRKISILKCKTLRDFLSAILYGKIRNAKRKTFLDFVESEVGISKNSYYSENIGEANSNYDIFVTGSDQVWNLNLTGNDWHFYLDFVNDEKKKISYAASIVALSNDESKEAEIRKRLCSFDHISLREKSGLKYVEKLGIADANLVIDPTLLVSREKWVDLSKRYTVSVDLPEKYLLAYFVSPTKTNIDHVRSLAAEVHLPIVLINYTHRKEENVINMTCVSPGQFVYLFDRATMVVTNSFHGTAFSINLNKDFLYVLNTQVPEKNERILTLVQLLGLEDRDFATADLNNPINWSLVNERLGFLRDESIKKLMSYIES